MKNKNDKFKLGGRKGRTLEGKGKGGGQKKVCLTSQREEVVKVQTSLFISS